MFADDAQRITLFSDFIKPLLKADQRWYGMEDSDGALSKSLQRSQQFLLLSALLTLLLSVAAVAVAMGHHCRSLVGLGFEAILTRLLAPVLPTALPAAGLWPWVWALGSLVVMSLLVGLRPYRLLLATQRRRNISVLIQMVKSSRSKLLEIRSK